VAILIINTRTRNCNGCGFSFTVVELGGVEPPSESALTQTSPGADGYFGLMPISLAAAQTATRLRLSSFIVHGASKA